MLLKVPFTCPQQNFEKKMIKVIYTIIDFFGILREDFSDCNKKMFRRVETVIKCTEGKTSENTHEKLVFRFSWTLTRKTCSCIGKILAGLSKLLSTCPKEPSESKISGRKSWNFRIFGEFLKFSGQWRKSFIRVGKTAIEIRWNNIWKFFFKRETFAHFPDSDQFLSFYRKFSPDLRNPQSRYPWKFLGEKYIWNFLFSSTLLWSLIQKTLGR